MCYERSIWSFSSAFGAAFGPVPSFYASRRFACSVQLLLSSILGLPPSFLHLYMFCMFYTSFETDCGHRFKMTTEPSPRETEKMSH